VATPEERKMAMLAHVLQIFGGFLAPLIIYIVSRESKFVRFHALQPLIWHGCLFVINMMAMFVFVASILLTIPMQQKPHEPPIGFFVMFGGIWMLMMGAWVVNVILAIYFGIKSYEGAWSRYPLIGHLAAKWAGV
jgi:uncharacterized Tic20 family protein